jgi:DNA-binding transcriptional LysR family regulator
MALCPLMDRFAGIETFVAVAQTLSFSKAAKTLGLTPSAVSKSVLRLESRLGVQLVRRTTRNMTLTDEGADYCARCERLLGDLREIEHTLAQGGHHPHGRVRLDTTVALGTLVVAPALPRLLSRFPALQVDLTLHNQPVSLVEESLDVVIRIGELPASGLRSRRLAKTRMIVCGAPSYLDRRGRPTTLDALEQHQCLAYLRAGRPAVWSFARGAKDVSVQVKGPLHSDNGEVLRKSAVAGTGLVQLFDFIVAESLRNGELEAVLENFAPPASPITALHLPNRNLLPKVRVVLDFLVDIFGRPSVDMAGSQTRW